jgi:hypothetical protein
MKFATVTKTLVMGLALLLASSAFASSKATLQLNNPTSVNGTTLKPGEYKLEWDGTGPSIQLSIKQGKNTVATVPAKLVDLDFVSKSNAAVTKDGVGGARSLAGIRLEGKKFALQLDDSGEAMQPGSSK